MVAAEYLDGRTTNNPVKTFLALTGQLLGLYPRDGLADDIGRPDQKGCGCRKLCRGWSGGVVGPQGDAKAAAFRALV